MSKILSKWMAALLLFSILTLRALADQVVMSNGDVLNGAVLSLSSNVLVLKNENLGVVKLQRVRVAAIHFGDAPPPTPAAVPSSNKVQSRPPAASQSATNADPMGMLLGIRANSNLVQQVQAQFLSDASPEATAKFNELLDGLSTGKMDLNDLRAEAKSAADQLRAYKKELGPDADDELDGYLGVLDAFLRETAPTNAAAPSAPAPKPANSQAKP
jgi:hypothetical protein